MDKVISLNAVSKSNSIINLWKVLFILSGFAPVTCIALHVLEILPLNFTGLYFCLPVLLLMIAVICSRTDFRSILLKGWMAGVFAVALYDTSRIPFILFGWNDFIPHIGIWLTGSEDHATLIGYLWRYIGNGGGMGIAFLILIQNIPSKISRISIGIIYGVLIFSILMMTLVLSPNGEEMMFEITVFTFSGSLLGHVVYGLTLGLISDQKKIK